MSQKILCVAAALVAATASAGQGWRHLEPQEQRAVESANFLLGTDASLWLFGADGIRRVDAGGATTGWLPGAPILGELTSDGGAVFLESSSNCLVKRVDAAVRVRWARQLPDICVVAPAGDAVWVANHSGKLYRLDADGAIERQIDIAIGDPQVAAMPDGGVAVVARSGTPMRSTLTRYGRDGAQIWTVTRDAYLSSVAASADGTLTASGWTTTARAMCCRGPRCAPSRDGCSCRRSTRTACSRGAAHSTRARRWRASSSPAAMRAWRSRD